MHRKLTLGAKIKWTMLGVVLAALVVVGVIFGISLNGVGRTLRSANEDMASLSGQASLSSMTGLTQARLREMASAKADQADEVFRDFKRDVAIVAETAERIYASPEEFAPRAVPLPDAANNGVLSIQMLYADYAKRDDPDFIREAELLGNIQDTIYAVNDHSENMASLYYAAASGFMVQADYIAARKFDANGELMPLNANERPWYVGASMMGGAYITPVTKDAHTEKLALMCGVPVYHNGKLMGVAGAGIYLDDIDKLVHEVDLGAGGQACIMNRFGQILFSTFDEGTLAVSVDAPNIRASQEEALAAAAKRAAAGETGLEPVTVDGHDYYLAFAPMKTVGWSFMIVLDKVAVEAPARQLVARLDQMNTRAINDAEREVNRSLGLLLAMLLVATATALGTATLLSRHIVKPIRDLTAEVHRLEGDNLDFSWHQDTGDEIQELADSFGSLTGRMKDYIRDIREVTAEKEKIGAELSIATQIQAGMLPDIFPPFPDRTDIDIFAVMDPAKEVGGDFYDFFLVDDDHLCVVMADVCGKGVPAALFMMASMIILRNNAKMGKSPAKILEDTNDSICANNKQEMFVTVWLGILEVSTGKLTAANAGHEYPSLRRPDGAYELVKDRHGFVIGGLPGEEYEEYEWQLEPGSQLFLYTDGVAEAMNTSRELFGTGRMTEALNECAGRPPREVLTHVREAVDAFVGEAEQFDDLTMLCLDYRGRDTGAEA